MGISLLIFGGVFTGFFAWLTKNASYATFAEKQQYGMGVLFIGAGIMCIVRGLFKIAKQVRLLKVSVTLIGDGRVLRVRKSREGRVLDKDMIFYEDIEDVVTIGGEVIDRPTKTSSVSEVSLEYSKRYMDVELLTKSKNIPLAFCLTSDDAENLIFIIKRKLGMDRSNK